MALRIGRKILFSLIAVGLMADPALARGPSLIRDAEIENTIRAYGAPLFAMAGLEPSSVRVLLIKDPRLNAFVAGGQNIFLNTGLLMESDTPNQVIGVIAHETGHISGGHLARTQDALRDASAQSIIALVLGAAAIAGGAGSAGGALIAGGATAAQRSFLKYSRTQEGAADQAALRFLDETGQSARGMLEFFEKLGDQEALLTANQDPYVRTHPLTRERVDTIRAHVANSPYSDVPDPPELIAAHERMKAKLRGFLDTPVQTFRHYPESDTSLPARYARVVAYHKQNDLERAIAGIDELLAENPDDPYFLELKGQVLFESGRIDESIPPYIESVRRAPNEPLLLIGLGQAQASSNDDANIKPAIETLEAAVRLDRRSATAWRWLATAYGRDQQIGMARLATAERYLLLRRYRDAGQQAARALQVLPTGSPGHLRAQDIEAAAKTARDKRK